MRKGQPASQSRPSQAQANLLLAAVRNDGYLTARMETGRYRRTFEACKSNGWFTEDGRITFAGRDAARRYSADAYAAALPADHVDFEMNRIARVGRAPLPPLGGTFGSPAHVLAIPDTFITYDVKPGALGRHVGYHINTDHGLRVIQHVEYMHDGDWVIGAQVFLSDGKGDVEYAGTAYSEVQVYGPAGNPDLRQNAADLLARTRAAHEQLTGRPAAVTPAHTNPNTERADTLVTRDDVAQLDETSAAETGTRYSAVMVAPGAEPVTGTPYHLTQDDVRQALQDVAAVVARRRQTMAQTPGRWDGPVTGQAGGGKSFLPELAAPVEYPIGVTADQREVSHPYAYRPGKSYEMLMRLLRDARDNRMFVYDPKPAAHTGFDAPAILMPVTDEAAELFAPRQELSPATLESVNHTLGRMNEALAVASAKTGINPATVARLAPAVDPGPLLDQVNQVRDAIVAIIGNQEGIAGDVTAASYRLQLLSARTSPTNRSEAARAALMQLETALSEIENGRVQVARIILARAGRRLARR